MKRSPPSLSSSSISTGGETLDDYESLNCITTSDTQSSISSDIRDAGKRRGGEIEMSILQPESSPAFKGRKASPTPSMLTRRTSEEESILNGQAAGYENKRRLQRAGSGNGGRRRGGEKKEGVKRRHSSNEHANVYTECGRHSDDWLFGGFSVTDAVKKIWQKGGKDSG
ncbi:hypothetical protein BCIN_13g05470 [Botrytis cinerea B05.10]|uniref:Uncharacterized protein n=1 Tax=Botryotinia fuckeliana (strain B05.10) TaxID=332648 RepID=A0A384K1L7_BOTFB|nr:hypothetical protein BCIN_13g05470 [Botrytis cinerea B05.10]ATZ56715.1 hypothetical protein BCIN_13g05470 [Botrytis cinerea B05.10]